MGDLTASGLTRLVVFPRHRGLRLDQFLAEATALSRRRARVLAGAGLVWRNGTAARILSRRVVPGDIVDVLRPPEELEVPPRPVLPPVDILWQDRWLVLADKPAGVLSQPAEGQKPDELAFDQRMLLHLAVGEGRRPELHLVHRLDRVTSGVLLFTRHHEAAAPVQRAWSQGKVQRLYLAVVEGVPPFDEMVVDEPIARDPGHAWRFKVSHEGRSAVPRVRVLARLSGISVVACSLVTGRTHQVRVHMASLGHPVLGDGLDGGRAAPAPRPPLPAPPPTLAPARRSRSRRPSPPTWPPAGPWGPPCRCERPPSVPIRRHHPGWGGASPVNRRRAQHPGSYGRRPGGGTPSPRARRRTTPEVQSGAARLGGMASLSQHIAGAPRRAGAT